MSRSLCVPASSLDFLLFTANCTLLTVLGGNADKGGPNDPVAQFVAAL
jgi:hypothetical protein